MIHKLLVLLLCGMLLSSSVAFAATTNFNYDSNGNLLSNLKQKYEYNGLNQLAKVFDDSGKLVEEYTYDSLGNRIRKIEYLANGKMQKTYYLSKNLVRVVNELGTFDTRYMYDGDGTLVARKDSDGKVFYYHADHLGSTSLVTDAAGKVVEETTYLPFGEIVDGGVQEKFLYNGKEKDGSGLYYYGARYYDPLLKRFTQADTVIPDVYDPQLLNRYSYVRNNPYSYTDPDGHLLQYVYSFINFVMEYILIPAMQQVGVTVANYYESIEKGIKTGDWSGVGDATKNEIISAGVGKIGGKVVDTVFDAKPKLSGDLQTTKDILTSSNRNEFISQFKNSNFPSDVTKEMDKGLFKKSTGKSNLFKISQTPQGYTGKYFSPAENDGYGKLFTLEVDQTGKTIHRYRETIGPKGEILKTTYEYKNGVKVTK